MRGDRFQHPSLALKRMIFRDAKPDSQGADIHSHKEENSEAYPVSS